MPALSLPTVLSLPLSMSCNFPLVAGRDVLGRWNHSKEVFSKVVVRWWGARTFRSPVMSSQPVLSLGFLTVNITSASQRPFSMSGGWNNYSAWSQVFTFLM